MSTEKLFLLEIYVDRICLRADVRCVFPSLVLKLFDYDAASISKPDNTFCQKTAKLLNEKSRKICPLQLDELKDASGNFVICSGKSILFRAQPDFLEAQCNSLPIYVVLLDLYSGNTNLESARNTGQFVGVVSISIRNISDRISGGKKLDDFKGKCDSKWQIGGVLTICNLFGEAIGETTMKIRMIRLEDGLCATFQHLIPRNSPRIILNHAQNNHQIKPNRENAGSEFKHQDAAVQYDPYLAEHDTLKEVLHKASGIDDRFWKPEKTELNLDNNNNNNNPPAMQYNCWFDNVDKREMQKEFLNQNSENQKENINFENMKNTKNWPLLNQLISEIDQYRKLIDTKNQYIEPHKHRQSEIQPKFDVQKNSINKKPRHIRPNSEKSSNSDWIKLSPCNKIFTRNKSINEDHETPEQFIRRISTPKFVSENTDKPLPAKKGWLRSTPKYSGPSRSDLNFQMNKITESRINRAHQQHSKYLDNYQNQLPFQDSNIDVSSNLHKESIPCDSEPPTLHHDTLKKTNDDRDKLEITESNQQISMATNESSSTNMMSSPRQAIVRTRNDLVPQLALNSSEETERFSKLNSEDTTEPELAFSQLAGASLHSNLRTTQENLQNIPEPHISKQTLYSNMAGTPKQPVNNQQLLMIGPQASKRSPKLTSVRSNGLSGQSGALNIPRSVSVESNGDSDVVDHSPNSKLKPQQSGQSRYSNRFKNQKVESPLCSPDKPPLAPSTLTSFQLSRSSQNDLSVVTSLHQPVTQSNSLVSENIHEVEQRNDHQIKPESLVGDEGSELNDSNSFSVITSEWRTEASTANIDYTESSTETPLFAANKPQTIKVAAVVELNKNEIKSKIDDKYKQFHLKQSNPQLVGQIMPGGKSLINVSKNGQKSSVLGIKHDSISTSYENSQINMSDGSFTRVTSEK